MKTAGIELGKASGGKAGADERAEEEKILKKEKKKKEKERKKHSALGIGRVECLSHRSCPRVRSQNGNEGTVDLKAESRPYLLQGLACRLCLASLAPGTGMVTGL